MAMIIIEQASQRVTARTSSPALSPVFLTVHEQLMSSSSAALELVESIALAHVQVWLNVVKLIPVPKGNSGVPVKYL